jgi:YD repeat-containing protein
MHCAVDVSRIADVPFREEVLRAALDLGHESRCDGRAVRPAGRGPARLVILADLSSLAPAYSRSGWAAWRECFPSLSPFLVAFVRHRDDPSWGHLLDRMMVSSACRLWLYKVGPNSLKKDLQTCLTEFTSHLDPEAVLDVGYDPSDRTVRIDFADGERRTLPWAALQLPLRPSALRPETIRVGDNPELIEILDADGEVYDIATARLRALAGAIMAGAPALPRRGSRPLTARCL